MNAITATFHPEGVAQEIITWLSDKIEAASTIDWVFLLIALAIAYFLVKSIMAVTRVGPVEVELLECDTGAGAEVHALTAALRERLANGGLPAPVVPSGTPHVSLVDAVAASPIPQAGFVAKLVEAAPIPEPPQFRLSGTLFQKKKRAGISFWLRPNRGRALMKTMTGAPQSGAVSYDGTIREAAFAVYSFISTEATQAFPTWARWRSAGALDDYAKGSEAALAGDFQYARAYLLRAIKKEPDNALVNLQLANVEERLARESEADDGSESECTDKEESAKRKEEAKSQSEAKSQAEALRRYLWIADEWAWLVQARYRASVLAGSLAAACADDHAARLGACEGLGGKIEPEQVKSIAETIAQSESKFARQLLRPWYMLVRWRRLRSQFEPSAEERRDLKRAVGISKHCQGLRLSRLRPNEHLHCRLAKWLVIRYREVAVRFWHLSFGLIGVDWQTHYVAACFEALLLEHAGAASGRGRGKTEPKGSGDGFLQGLLARRRRWWSGHLHRNAFRHLDQATAESGHALPISWVLHDDRDLRVLRKTKEWQLDTRELEAKDKQRRTRRRAHARWSHEKHDDWHGPVEEEQTLPLLVSPRRPWPKPILRIAYWAVLGVLAAICFLVFTSESVEWIAALCVVLLLAIWQIVQCFRERRWRKQLKRYVGGKVVSRSSRRP